ncbi:PREDICTED: uncharacterized protein LOC106816626 [Priapulus caudatus]|uniref:Uncharacterized protein LOC106816626 n=1 Tax=Priapulus caudatus TaxID=37621 RepID=A0ABM1EX14_PRICU|nr:PREDICTED: uncharacterized protein LOC106816626 [Priapulus caudatus]
MQLTPDTAAVPMATTVHLFSPWMQSGGERVCFSFKYRSNTRKKVYITVELETEKTSRQAGRTSTGRGTTWKKFKAWINIAERYRVIIKVRIPKQGGNLDMDDVTFSRNQCA